MKENSVYGLKKKIGELLNVDPGIFQLIYGGTEVMHDGLRLRRYYLHEGSVHLDCSWSLTAKPKLISNNTHGFPYLCIGLQLQLVVAGHASKCKNHLVGINCEQLIV